MKIDTGMVSASMANLQKTLTEMQDKTKKIMADAMGFSAMLKSEISAASLDLTREISTIIAKSQQVIQESSTAVLEGAILTAQVEELAKGMKGRI